MGEVIHANVGDIPLSKLLEALRTFTPDLSGVKAALDLGAAPGGWTRVLAENLGISRVTVWKKLKELSELEESPDTVN